VLAERHIRAAEKLGAKTIRIDPGGRERHWSAEQFDAVVATYKAWAKRAADGGYRIGPERHWGAGNHVDNLLKLTAAVASPAFGILLHMGKDVDGDPAAADAALAPHAMHVHLVETVIDGRLGESLQILREARYSGAVAVELQAGEDEYAQVARCLARLRPELSR
jgi:sugar phosphate isomerase/epimerase